jgi:HSP20 family protein
MLVGWRNFNDALRTFDLLNRQFDSIHDSWIVTGSEREAGRRRAASPAVHVTETKEAFVYQAEVPGLDEGDVTIQLEDESLLLRGQRKGDARQGYEVRLQERAPLAFAHKLPLPGRIDAAAVTATLKEGILTVTLPRAKDALPRQIAVKTA